MKFRGYQARSIRTTFLLVIAPVIICLTIGLVSLDKYRDHRATYQDLGEKLAFLMESQQAVLSKPLWNVDDKWCRQNLDSLLGDPDFAGAVVFDDNSSYFVGNGIFTGFHHQELVDFTKLVQGGVSVLNNKLLLRLDNTGKNIPNHEFFVGREELYFTTDSGKEKVGTLFIALTDKSRLEQFKVELLYDIFKIFLIIVVFLATIMAVYSRTTSVPLKKLHDAIIDIQKGNEHHNVAWEGKDEVSAAIAAYNNLQTQQLLSQKALRESEEMFRALFEQTGGYSMVLEPNETGIPTILDANKAACKLHGYSREEMIGRPVADLDDEEGKRLCRERTQHILSGKPLIIENIHVRKDGSSFPVAVFANVVTFKNKPPLILTTEFDITERVQAEEERTRLESQLQQAQKMEAIGTLAGGIAHDFNNILGVILGHAEIARDDCMPGSSVCDDLEAITTAGNRAKNLVRQILTFSRQDKAERLVLNPSHITKEVVKMLRSTLPATIRIEQEIDDKTNPVLANPTHLNQIIMNLCTNAFQSLEDTGGIVNISMGAKYFKPEEIPDELEVQPGEFIQLSVADSGPGIPPEVLDKIFDPYFTTKETGKGTGMGLSIVHGIVKSYNGFVTVKSELGKGAVFKVFIPTILDNSTPEKEADKQIQTGQERILFVDDDKELLRMGKVILERLGYRVTAIKSSIGALDTFQSEPCKFDMVITDQTMPDMTGSDLAKKILQIRPDIPIILCTGYSSLISKEKARLIGIKELIFKPIAKNDLADLIRKVLDAEGGRH